MPLIHIKYRCKLCNKVFTRSVKELEKFKFPLENKDLKNFAYYKHRCNDYTYGLSEFVGYSLQDDNQA